MKVWKFIGDTIDTVMNWECLPKSNSVETSPTLCKISWTPKSGYYLAVPNKNEVVLYERNSWHKAMSLTIPNFDEKQVSL